MSLSIGWGDWSFKTVNGTYLCNNGNGNEMRFSSTTIQGLDKWYFYNDHIIGYLNDRTGFVLEEKRADYKEFKNLSDFNHYLQKQQLIPSKQTYWHENMPDPNGEKSLFTFFIIIPVAMLVLTIWVVNSLFASRVLPESSARRVHNIFTKIIWAVFTSFVLIVLLWPNPPIYSY